MTTHADKAAHFLELHRENRPLLLANAWDVGSAKLLVSLGYQALATTSSGYAASLGRLDYGVTLEESLAHAAALVNAIDVPVSADLEECFAVDTSGVAETVRLALGTGLAGCSIEDWNPREQRLYDVGEAAERVAAAAEAAHASDVHLVLTARAENHLAAIGVKRISVGGGFAFAAYGAALQAASELMSDGTYSFTDLSTAGAKAARMAFAV